MRRLDLQSDTAIGRPPAYEGMTPTRARKFHGHKNSMGEAAGKSVPDVAAALPAAPEIVERDSYASTAFGEVVDRSLHAAVARFSAGLSPPALAEAYMDWAAHLASSPG